MKRAHNGQATNALSCLNLVLANHILQCCNSWFVQGGPNFSAELQEASRASQIQSSQVQSLKSVLNRADEYISSKRTPKSSIFNLNGTHHTAMNYPSFINTKVFYRTQYEAGTSLSMPLALPCQTPVTMPAYQVKVALNSRYLTQIEQRKAKSTIASAEGLKSYDSRVHLQIIRLLTRMIPLCQFNLVMSAADHSKDSLCICTSCTITLAFAWPGFHKLVELVCNQMSRASTDTSTITPVQTSVQTSKCNFSATFGSEQDRGKTTCLGFFNR